MQPVLRTSKSTSLSILVPLWEFKCRTGSGTALVGHVSFSSVSEAEAGLDQDPLEGDCPGMAALMVELSKKAELSNNVIWAPMMKEWGKHQCPGVETWPEGEMRCSVDGSRRASQRETMGRQD